jgi:anti-sigma-K factor RskA
MSDIHELAAFYALGALSTEDRAAFEAHVDGCRRCQMELAEYDAGVEALARSVAEPAPAEMKSEVMARIDAADRSVGGTGGTVTPLFRRVAPLIVAAAAIAALVFVIGLGSVTEQERIDAVLAARDAVTVNVEGEVVSSAEVVYTPSGDAVFSAAGLSTVSETQTYQLWLIGDEGPVSAGVFRPDSDGGALVLLDGEVRPGLVLGLTIEPAGGSDAPTGDILIAQDV